MRSIPKMNNYAILLCTIWILSAESFSIGKSTIPKIVGGTDATPGEIPYQALIRSSRGIFCGGSIISINWALTAAHCINREAAYYVLVGSTKFDEGTIYVASKMFVHESWNPDALENDIALIKIYGEFVFSNDVKAIGLPTKPLPANSSLVASGWGGTYGGSPIPTNLQVLKVRSLSPSECSGIVAPDSDTKLCTLAYNGGGTCFGDSGGPFVNVEDNTLHGIASYIISGTCERNLPNVQTRVYHYVDWIRDTQNKN